MTLHDATTKWIYEWNAIPIAVIERLISDGKGEWYEMTAPAIGDVADVYRHGDGEVVAIGEDDDGEPLYTIRFYGGEEETFHKDDFEIERDDVLPMWGTMWTFGESLDDDWLENGGIEAMSECGYRVYYIEDLGYCFGIDGAGYDFCEAHHEPLYRRRGLRWHDEIREETIFGAGKN